jgi:hypothetical protein
MSVWSGCFATTWSPRTSRFIDDSTEPIATYRPPARVNLDTRELSDGEHVMRIEATYSLGNVGVRRIGVVVANGPGITVTGLREGSRVRRKIEVDVNAFGADEPFDPVRAESSGPIPVWTWVLIVIIGVWALWYGLEFFPTPPAFAQTPTYAPNPALAAAVAPATATGAQTAAPWAVRTLRRSIIRRSARKSTRRVAPRVTAKAEPVHPAHFRLLQAILSLTAPTRTRTLKSC